MKGQIETSKMKGKRCLVIFETCRGRHSMRLNIGFCGGTYMSNGVLNCGNPRWRYTVAESSVNEIAHVDLGDYTWKRNNPEVPDISLRDVSTGVCV